MKRRSFIKTAGAAAVAGLAGSHLAPGIARAHSTPTVPVGKATNCIMLWLNGGMSQTDTFDIKRLGDPAKREPGSAYPGIDTSVSGVQVCEHLPRMARLMEHVTAVRTVNHNVIDEHAAATNRMHTGRPTSGTVVYPSIGSIIAHELGAINDAVPPYVLMGYPSPSRGPGFLGPTAGYVYFTDHEAGPVGLSRPQHISDSQVSRREQLLEVMKDSSGQRHPGDMSMEDYAAAIEQSARLSGDEFIEAFQLDDEPDSLRQEYGSVFGQRMLLARRLIQRGVRFQEIGHNLNFTNGTGWDTHNEGQLKQHLLIQDLDQALSTFMADLQKHNLLDDTLIVINSEFGRPIGFDGGGGRGHQGSAFTVALAGGGLNHCGVYGVTCDDSKEIVEDPVSVPDLFATMTWALGVDPSKYLYDGDRPVPITDGGQPIARLFS